MGSISLPEISSIMYGFKRWLRFDINLIINIDHQHQQRESADTVEKLNQIEER
jgi:hypothetical protein